VSSCLSMHPPPPLQQSFLSLCRSFQPALAQAGTPISLSMRMRPRHRARRAPGDGPTQGWSLMTTRTTKNVGVPKKM
jgi:hypothetical protein